MRAMPSMTIDNTCLTNLAVFSSATPASATTKKRKYQSKSMKNRGKKTNLIGESKKSSKQILSQKNLVANSIIALLPNEPLSNDHMSAFNDDTMPTIVQNQAPSLVDLTSNMSPSDSSLLSNDKCISMIEHEPIDQNNSIYVSQKYNFELDPDIFERNYNQRFDLSASSQTMAKSPMSACLSNQTSDLAHYRTDDDLSNSFDDLFPPLILSASTRQQYQNNYHIKSGRFS
jgi:hypothetical protein